MSAAPVTKIEELCAGSNLNRFSVSGIAAPANPEKVIVKIMAANTTAAMALSCVKSPTAPAVKAPTTTPLSSPLTKLSVSPQLALARR